MTEAEIIARDAALCRCGHPCASHGSFDREVGFVGTGMGPCGHECDLHGGLGSTPVCVECAPVGWCDCQRFVPAVTTRPPLFVARVPVLLSPPGRGPTTHPKEP